MSFGFSVGDFLAVGAFVFRISFALSEYRSSSRDFSQTTEYLRSLAESSLFKEVKKEAEKIIARKGGSGHGAHGIANGLLYQGKRFLGILTEFEDQFISYARSISKAKVVRTFRKVGWVICGSENARKLEERPQSHIVAINALLQLAQSPGMTLIQENATEIKNAS